MTFPGLMSLIWNTKNRVSEATHEQCSAVGAAIAKGDIGETVTAIQQLILRYYDNVRGQAEEAFESAKRVALFGFVLLVATVAYVMFKDWTTHPAGSYPPSSGGIGVGAIGLIASSVVEVVASVQFVLYGRAARQFGAFHICLERTHRYLLAYKMAEQITNSTKDETLEKIVCIMANAPMITREDIDGLGSGGSLRPEKKSARERAAGLVSAD